MNELTLLKAFTRQVAHQTTEKTRQEIKTLSKTFGKTSKHQNAFLEILLECGNVMLEEYQQRIAQYSIQNRPISEQFIPLLLKTMECAETVYKESNSNATIKMQAASLYIRAVTSYRETEHMMAVKQPSMTANVQIMSTFLPKQTARAIARP